VVKPKTHVNKPVGIARRLYAPCVATIITSVQAVSHVEPALLRVTSMGMQSLASHQGMFSMSNPNHVQHVQPIAINAQAPRFAQLVTQAFM
jgi:hypothetical protein